MGLLDGLYRVGEPALGLLSGAVAEPVAGWAGLLSGGNAQNVESTRNMLTYRPRTAAGMAGQNALANALLGIKTTMVDNNPPVRMASDGYNALADRLGMVSPALGAATKTAPVAAMAFAGPGSAVTRNAFGNVGRGSFNALAPKAGQMAENYMRRTGGLLEMDVYAPNRITPEHYRKVLEEMRQLGAPKIRAVWDGESYKALEGSHRIAAANELGLNPIIEEVPMKSWLTNHDLYDLPEKTSAARAYQYLYDRPDVSYYFPDLER